MSNTPIADHGLLSDRHSTALIDRSGSVEWLSFPRFDSPSSTGFASRGSSVMSVPMVITPAER